MLTDSILEFLKKPLLARLSVIDKDGYPHSVPVWFDVDGDDIMFISVRDTAKVRYLQMNSKGAVTVGGDTDDGGGYLIKGQLSIEDDTDHRWTRQLTYRYEEPEQAEKDIAAWIPLGMIVIRLKPEKILKV